jgi:hypothetical protein
MHALKFVAEAAVVPGVFDVLGLEPHAPSTKPSVTTPATTVIHRTRKAFSLLDCGPAATDRHRRSGTDPHRTGVAGGAIRETVPPTASATRGRAIRVTESWPSDQHQKDDTG